MRLFIVAIMMSCVFLISGMGDDWGFFGHRLINKMAVYTLPPEMIALYKPNIDFITEHAVDPDKRRYASPFEGIRHYIDLDNWGEYPFDTLPRKWEDALIKFIDIIYYSSEKDSVIYKGADRYKEYLEMSFEQRELFRTFFREQISSGYYDENWSVDCAAWLDFFEEQDLECSYIRVVDSLSAHGVLPYHLLRMFHRLTHAFESGDQSDIIRLSAEIGHYLGDAHVPLHTTKNYNGQLTGQLGIHAFWESRIPELFAEDEFDFFVGKAEYIADPRKYFWDIALQSHLLVDSVLQIEKRLSQSFPSDRQFCFDERLETITRLPCRDYARAYSDAMQGMVEERFRASIKSVGDVWYTAWIDAGQPSFGIDRKIEMEEGKIPSSLDTVSRLRVSQRAH